MRTLVTAVAIGLLGTWIASGRADDAKQQGKWLDLEHCAVCKALGENPDLLKNMTWEVHPIDNGMLMMTSVSKDHVKDLETAHEKMMKTVDKLKAGEKMELCGFCQSYGQLMMAGAKPQEIKTAIGTITLLTSEDPEVVKQIQAHAKRTIEEQKKLHDSHEHKSAA